MAICQRMQICKEGGAILLLEHGTSSYSFLNKILDNNVLSHFKRWGCIWNRDIIHLIKRCNMEVVYSSRIHFGTTYYIICKPKKGNTIIEKGIYLLFSTDGS
jgi:methyltransferase OMS1